MSESEHISTPAILAVLAFGLLTLVGGWIIVQGGGFFHSPTKHSTDAIFYTGAPALLMAVLQFTASALTFTWLLRLRWRQAASAGLAFALVFVPPLIFLALQ